jgi:molybdopterin-guanine dinucleotide biosynthesis protein A
MYDEYELYGGIEDPAPDEETLERWFMNVNTPQDLADAEAWALSMPEGGCGVI